MKPQIPAIVVVVGVGVAVAAGAYLARRTTIGEKIDDALDNRPAEGVRDVVEDATAKLKHKAQ